MADPTTSPEKSRPQAIRWFALVGPLFGAWGFLFVGSLLAGKPPTFKGTLYLGLWLYPASLVFGLIPALATGAAYSQLIKDGMINPEHRIQRVLAAALIGAIVGAIWLSLLNMFPGTKVRLTAALYGAAVGGAASAGCALIWPLPTRQPAI